MSYVLSAKVEPGSPIALVEEAALYDRFYEDAKATPEVGYFPWYSKPRTGELPEGLCLITKAKSYNFDIRGISRSLYIVSETFLKVMTETDSKPTAVRSIEVRTKVGKKPSEKAYFVVRLPYLSFDDAVDKEGSIFEVNGGRHTLQTLKTRIDIVEPLFLIDDLLGSQSTVFCSKQFFLASNKYDLKGIEFVEDEAAKWQGALDFMSAMGGDSQAGVVQPI